MKQIEKWKSEGLVFGNYWGGGKGAYPARKLSADTKEELIEQASHGLDGTLDAGMGYESLIGALLEETKITTVIIDDKPFINEESNIEFIGELTEKDKNFLIDCYFER
jgi:hypothetical protein